RALSVTFDAVTQQGGAAVIDVRVKPSHVLLRRGQSVSVNVSASVASALLGGAETDGAIVAHVAGGGAIRVPWAVAFATTSVDLIAGATLSETAFAASDEAPTLLSVDAGRVLDDAGHVEIHPVRLLDILL